VPGTPAPRRDGRGIPFPTDRDHARGIRQVSATGANPILSLPRRRFEAGSTFCERGSDSRVQRVGAQGKPRCPTGNQQAMSMDVYYVGGTCTKYRDCARCFAPTGCRRPLPVGLDLLATRSPIRDWIAEISGFSQVPGRTLLYTCLGLIPRGTPDARPLRHRGDSFPLVPRCRLPDLNLSRLITTACALAVYASQQRVTPAPRKSRFRWVANPCRVGFDLRGPLRRVSGSVYCIFLPPFPGLAWRKAPLGLLSPGTEKVTIVAVYKL